MNVQEYVAKSKAELDKFQAAWEQGMKDRPGHYPEQLAEGDWADQELSDRFGGASI